MVEVARPGAACRARWSSQVTATAVNRADVMQREGHYPPPPGASDILGLECAGVIASVGEGVTEWQLGDRVCALLSGGGYAERVAVPAGQVLPDARRPRRRPGRRPAGGGLHRLVQRVHDRGAPARRGLPRPRRGSGIGTMAIQLGQAGSAPGSRAPSGRSARRRSAATLGADLAVNYREQDFVEEVRQLAGDARRRRRDPRHHGRLVPPPQRRPAGHRGPARRDRAPGRRQGRARPERPAAQARSDHRHHPARPTGRGEGRDRGERPGQRLAAGRGRDRSGRSSTRRSASTRWPRRTEMVDDGAHIGKVVITTSA